MAYRPKLRPAASLTTRIMLATVTHSHVALVRFKKQCCSGATHPLVTRTASCLSPYLLRTKLLHSFVLHSFHPPPHAFPSLLLLSQITLSMVSQAPGRDGVYRRRFFVAMLGSTSLLSQGSHVRREQGSHDFLLHNFCWNRNLFLLEASFVFAAY